MITRLSHTSISVLDQDRARKFYTEVLGFDVRTDMSMDGFRWLTVSPKDQPEFEIVLLTPGPPMFSAEDAALLRGLIEKGALSGGVLETEDCRKTFVELKAKGVTFLQEPAERPYGIETVFRDDSGNWFSLTQRLGPK